MIRSNTSNREFMISLLMVMVISVIVGCLLISGGCVISRKQFVAGQCVQINQGFLKGCYGRVDGFDEDNGLYHFSLAKCPDGVDREGYHKGSDLIPFDGCEVKK